MEKKIVKIGVIDCNGYELDNRVYDRGGYYPQSRQATQEYTSSARSKQIKMIGNMDNTIDHTFESANRVYDRRYCLPTIPTCGCGGLQPKVIRRYAKK